MVTNKACASATCVTGLVKGVLADLGRLLARACDNTTFDRRECVLIGYKGGQLIQTSRACEVKCKMERVLDYHCSELPGT